MTNLSTSYLLRIDSKPIKYEWEQLSNGIVRAFGVLGKANLPLDYYQWDGSEFKKRTETIELEQLFNEDSLQTAWGMPVTLGHTPGGLFNANSDNLMIGSCLQEFRKDEANGELGILLTIHDKRGIELIQSEEAAGRFAELSPTYYLKSTSVRNDGVYLQQGRQYDSIALLRQGEGRGGSSVRLRVDGADHCLPENSAVSTRFFIPNIKKEDRKLMDLALKIDGKDKVFRDVDDTLGAEVKSILSRVDSLESQLNTFNSEKSALQAKLDSTELKLSETEEKLKNANNQRMDSNAIGAELDRRAAVWDLVEPVLSEIAKNNGKSFRRDNKLSVAEIQRLFLTVKAPHLNLDGKDEVYLATAWDCLKPTAEDSQKAQEKEKQESITRVDSLLEELNIKGGNASGDGVPNLDAANDNARKDYINSIQNKGK